MLSLNIGASGMLAQQLNVDVISNNLANMTTTGYKRQRAQFQDLMYQNIERPGATSSDVGTIVPSGIQLGLGVKAASVHRLHSQGSAIITDNEFDVAIMNANRKNWPMTAYLNFHIENGKKEYQIVKAMTKQYSMPLECAIFLLAGGYSMWRETRNDFKQGKFKIKSLQRCNEIGASLMFMKNNFNIRLTRSFITAYAVVSEHPKFKWERFKTALKSKSALLLRGTNTEDFVRVFDKIYNGNVHNKINFTRYFLDREYQDDEEGDDS